MGRHAARVLWRLAPAGGAALVCWALPPRVAFVPQPLLGLLFVLLGLLATLIPGQRALAQVLRGAGELAPWGVLLWVVLSQPAPLTDPLGRVWGLRALPVLVGAALWGWLRLSLRWQRRTVLALALPTVLSLSLVAWASPATPQHFVPYYLAVDSHGTLYVTDGWGAVIRVFGRDGALIAKLRPGLASWQGVPGPGFEAPGPYNDPDRLGVTRATSGAGLITGSAPNTAPRGQTHDEFAFCGLAVDHADRLFVPDPRNGLLLRFLPNGRLDASWPLPADFGYAPNCVAVAGQSIYLTGTTDVIHLDLDGHLLARWPLPVANGGNVGQITGGIAAAPNDRAVYAVLTSEIARIDPKSGAVTRWVVNLPASAASISAWGRLPRYPRVFRQALALRDGRLLVTDARNGGLLIYWQDGSPCGHLGQTGTWPGQLGQTTGLATSQDGDLYIADLRLRAVERFTPAFQIAAVYWSPDDDEHELS